MKKLKLFGTRLITSTQPRTPNVIKLKEGDKISDINFVEGDLLDADSVKIMAEQAATDIEAIITYSELKALRDAGELVPGLQYRITDYVTTTAQDSTQSAGHAFDVIVTADSTDELNESARAIQHAGDTYFANSKLGAWKLKYCLDNDTNRFAWADATNGKGVIYYMKDEWNNECPYDFKNIQFERYKITACPNSPSLVDSYCISDIDGITVDTTTTYWAYTFSMINLFEDVIDDVSVYQEKYPSDERFYYKTENNIIKEYYELGVLKLSNNVFITDTDLCAIEEDYSYGEFYAFCNNTFGQDCCSNTFGQNCFSNTFGQGCNSNTFGQSCYNNIFGQDCFSNTFGQSCNSNTFGQSCYNNTFGQGCNSNTFGQSCYNNTFGQGCNSNTFGQNCFSNTFGQGCYYNTFGQDCRSNTFSKDYTQCVIVENDNGRITLTSTQTTSFNNKLQNIKIAQCVNNTNTAKTISHDTVNDTFQTIYQPTNSQTILV